MILSRYNFCLLLEYLIFKVEAQFPFCVSPFVSLSCYADGCDNKPVCQSKDAAKALNVVQQPVCQVHLFQVIRTLTGSTYILPGFDNFELELCKLSISHLQKYNTIHINLQVQVIKVHDDVSPLVHGEEGWKNFLTTLLQLCGNIV